MKAEKGIRKMNVLESREARTRDGESLRAQCYVAQCWWSVVDLGGARDANAQVLGWGAVMPPAPPPTCRSTKPLLLAMEATSQSRLEQPGVARKGCPPSVSL